MHRQLSTQAQQTFQVVALLATILVVGIHYKSDVPNSPSAADATWNELTQEFLFGGIARVAVPLFAFAAGFFYFRSDDGCLSTYIKKLKQRSRTVLFPFFIVGSIATAFWLLVQRLNGIAVEWTLGEFLGTWWLHPPAEQLWFLRDLMVLVVVAPLIRMSCSNRLGRSLTLVILLVAWALNLQAFPLVAGWRVLHMETLLFFTLGCIAVAHVDWIERIGQSSRMVFAASVSLWAGLIAIRICVRADFDLWYVTDYGVVDLLLHHGSVLVGCVALFMTAWRIRNERMIQLSGAAFFVYLVHEFPLRAVVRRIADSVIGHSLSCWIATPVVLLVCFSAAFLLPRYCPTLVAMLTGGRTPTSRARITRQDARSHSPANAT